MENGGFNFNGGSSLPTRYVRLGDEFERYGVTLVCVRRKRGVFPADACRGCWFRRSRRPGSEVVINCNDIQCSSWDRMDGENVWFVEAGDGE